MCYVLQIAVWREAIKEEAARRDALQSSMESMVTAKEEELACLKATVEARECSMEELRAEMGSVLTAKDAEVSRPCTWHTTLYPYGNVL